MKNFPKNYTHSNIASDWQEADELREEESGNHDGSQVQRGGDEENLTPEEEANLSGYATASLVDSQYSLVDLEGEDLDQKESEEQKDSTQNPLVRGLFSLSIVGGIMSVAAIVWLIFLAPKQLPERAAEPSPKPAPAQKQDETGRLKAELALRDQAMRRDKDSQQRQQTPKLAPKPTQSPAAPTPANSSSTRSAAAPSSSSPPPPPPTVREPAPPPVRRQPEPPPAAPALPAPAPVAKVSSPPPKPEPEPMSAPAPISSPAPAPTVTQGEPESVAGDAEPVDPFEEWNRLAHLGEKRSTDGAGTSSQGNLAASDRLRLASKLSSLQRGDNSELLQGDRNTVPAAIPSPSLPVEATTLALPPAAAIAAMPQSAQPPQRSNARGIAPVGLPVQQVATATPIGSATEPVAISAAAPRLEPEIQSEEAIVSVADTEALTAGERGILTRTPQLQGSPSPTGAPKEIAIGTAVRARVVVPVVWSAEGQSLTVQRFAVELAEDAIASDGSVALTEGTILVTEVTNVAPANQIIEQTAVAAVNPAGQMALPPGAIAIRGKDGEPLIAKKINRDSGKLVGNDLIVGTLNGLALIGQIANQPDEEYARSESGIYGSVSERRTTRNKPNIPGAFIEGLFGTVGSRLAQRTDRVSQEIISRPKTLYVPEGTEVSVFFNNVVRIP